MAIEVKLDLSKYAKVLVDDTGAPATVYYGVTEYEKAATSIEEWSILRETVAAGITTRTWAAHSDGTPDAKFAWDDRATLSY
jgi:hypothetical protein